VRTAIRWTKGGSAPYEPFGLTRTGRAPSLNVVELALHHGLYLRLTHLHRLLIAVPERLPTAKADPKGIPRLRPTAQCLTPSSKSRAKTSYPSLTRRAANTGAESRNIDGEAGFQNGAIEAANLTNVRLTSLADLRQSAGAEISMMRIRDLQDRVDDCEGRYWAIEKEIRIEHELRLTSTMRILWGGRCVQSYGEY